MASTDNRTICQRYTQAVKNFVQLSEPLWFNERKDTASYQRKVSELLEEFTLIQKVAYDLDLFSSNEAIEEINPKYLPFYNLNYYLGCIYMNYHPASLQQGNSTGEHNFHGKKKSLVIAKEKLTQFLLQMQNLGGILTKTQSERLSSFKESYNPSNNELLNFHGNAADRRREKIENYKFEKQLRENLKILDEYYFSVPDDEEGLMGFEEETARAIYLDQLRLNTLIAFNQLQLLAAEIELHLKMAENITRDEEETSQRKSKEKPSLDNDYGFVPRVEAVPETSKIKVSDLVSKQGKILRPFTITANKSDLRQRVFGTGQVLPSMSVDDFLAYELNNGKMATEEQPKRRESDSENSEDELEVRRWDDWKDENPKGSGNMKANIG